MFQEETVNFSVCGHGRFIVLNSFRDANRFNIWRVDATGRNLKQLTEGSSDRTPHCSPDGAWVVYNATGGKARLMKVPLEGSQPITLMEPAIEIDGSTFSPDGSEVAFYMFPEGSGTSKIGIMNSAGGQPTKTFDLAPGGRVPQWDYSLLHWTPE